MAEPAVSWTARSAWANVLAPGRIGPAGPAGVAVEAVEGLGVATLIVAQSGRPALAAAVRERWAVDLPATPRIVRAGTDLFVWAGPDRWHGIAGSRSAVRDGFGALAGAAAVSDQSDAFAALRLTGPAVRDALAKGCLVDLHPRSFPDGAVALTAIAHVAVVVWREGDAFTVLAPRSMAGSFWSWLGSSAAAFGCEVRTQPA